MDSIAIAIVWQRGRVLVGRRPPGKTLAGLLEFPGGKCRPNESLIDACVRECFEETGLEVRVLGLRARIHHRYEHGEVDLHFFDCEVLDGSRELDARAPFAWLDPATLCDADFPPANASVLEELRQRPHGIA